MASEYTPNRRYPLYVATDKPNLRDQYNGAIREIDTDMKQALDDSSSVSSALGAGFDAQHTVRMAIDGANAAISSEATARTNADNQLAGSISSEATARANADSQLSTDISDEATARQQADSQLSTSISNEATARSNADNQLASSISSETAARQQADSQLSTRIENMSKIKIVVIGDSWSSDDTPSVNARGGAASWTHKMPSNITVYNFSSGAAGYVKNGNNGTNFAGQAQLAIDSQSFDNDDIDYVIVYGGVNDFSDSSITAQAVKTAANTLTSTLVSNFPNATIIGLDMNSYTDPAFASYQSYIDSIASAFTKAHCVCVNAFGWNVQGGRSWWADNLHPNEYGCAILASYILAVISGCGGESLSTGTPTNIQWQANDGAWSSYTPSEILNKSILDPFNGVLYLNLEIVTTLNLTSGTKFRLHGTLPHTCTQNATLMVTETSNFAITQGYISPSGQFTACINNVSNASINNVRIYIAGMIKLG